MKCLLIVALALAALLTAQVPNDSRGSATTRSVEGVVTDSKGAPEADAQVLLKDTKTLAVRSYITQQDGKYHFFGLSSDIDYEIHAQHSGEKSSRKTISVFDSHRVVTLDLKLK